MTRYRNSKGFSNTSRKRVVVSYFFVACTTAVYILFPLPLINQTVYMVWLSRFENEERTLPFLPAPPSVLGIVVLHIRSALIEYVHDYTRYLERPSYMVLESTFSRKFQIYSILPEFAVRSMCVCVTYE